MAAVDAQRQQVTLNAILRDPVPHFQRQMERLGLLVEEVLEHGKEDGSVEV